MRSERGAMRRRVTTTGETWVATGLPYGFALSSLGLGAAGIGTGQPVAGACGSVVGVAAALMERRRANRFERRVTTLRERVRDQRIDAELTASAQRRRIRELETALWERELRQLGGALVGTPAAFMQGEPVAPATATSGGSAHDSGTVPVVAEGVAEGRAAAGEEPPMAEDAAGVTDVPEHSAPVPVTVEDAGQVPIAAEGVVEAGTAPGAAPRTPVAPRGWFEAPVTVGDSLPAPVTGGTSNEAPVTGSADEAPVTGSADEAPVTGSADEAPVTGSADEAPVTAPMPVAATVGPPTGPIAEVIQLTEAREQSGQEPEGRTAAAAG